MFVQVAQSLMTHRKTLRAARLLSIDRYAVVGRLVALWSWCLDNAMDGCLGDVEMDILADVMGWDGKAADLVEALLTAGFLELRDGQFWVHDWDEHMLAWIERAQEQREANRARQARFRERHANAPAPPTPDPTGTDSSPNGYITVTPALRNADVTPKIRIDKIRLEEGESARASAPTPAHAHAREEKQAATARAAPRSLPVTSPAPEPDPPPTLRPAPKPARPPDVLWDTCAELYPAPTNKGERGKWNAALALLRESHATPEEVRAAHAAHLKRYGPDIDVNPMALANKWAQLMQEATRGHAHPDPRHTPVDLDAQREAKLAALRDAGVPLPPNHRHAPSHAQSGTE
jgi:hypothetical protein